MAGFPSERGQARPFALLWYWPGWPHLPRLACSSQVICSGMVLTRLATASLSSLVKPGHLLCYGIGQASLGFPGFLSPGQPGLGRADRGFWARLWPRSIPVWPGSWCKGNATSSFLASRGIQPQKFHTRWQVTTLTKWTDMLLLSATYLWNICTDLSVTYLI